jgi:hypothetical protein
VAAILVDPTLSEPDRRRALFAGDTVMLASTKASRDLCAFAWGLIEEAFAPIKPERAQFELPVEKFVEIISALKPRFTHHATAKKFMLGLLEETGCNPADTYFDVPKLRIVTHGGYLTAGMGYAYKAHRDIWYASPPSQINWWTPIRKISERSAMVIHPRYFDQRVANNSDQFDAYRWNADGRAKAATYIHEDPRPHPHLQEKIDLDMQVLVGQPGSLMLFSAQHLHATVPNDSGATRFSIDFRTVNREDITAHAGAKLTDSSATGTTLRDFIRATDHQRFPDEVIASYETGTPPGDGQLIFDASRKG